MVVPEVRTGCRGGVGGVSGAWAGADERGEERLRPGSEWILFVEKYGPRALWVGAWQGWGRASGEVSFLVQLLFEKEDCDS